MKIDSKNILLISLIIGSFLLFSLYTVYETDRVIILRLGKLVQDNNNKPLIVGPGLHIKWPFIDEIRSFDTRLNMLDIKSSSFSIFMTLLSGNIFFHKSKKISKIQKASFFLPMYRLLIPQKNVGDRAKCKDF